jgi:hypothetical protein
MWCREPAEAEKALGLIKNILALQNGVNKGDAMLPSFAHQTANKFFINMALSGPLGLNTLQNMY